MKISKITIKQLFGIKEWQGDGKNIELVGDNGTGKTSVIDAIRYALTNSSDREFIVKNGETEGEIYIETDNGLSIDRKARTAMTDYKSVKQNGNVIPSPESFLKTIFTPLQLSPMEFISMDKKTQNATILDMIQYDWNLDTIKEWFGEIPRDVNYEQNILAVLNDIQAENGYYFMHRQDVNRDIRAKKAVIADIGSSLPIDYDGESTGTAGGNCSGRCICQCTERAGGRASRGGNDTDSTASRTGIAGIYTGIKGTDRKNADSGIFHKVEGRCGAGPGECGGLYFTGSGKRRNGRSV